VGVGGIGGGIELDRKVTRREKAGNTHSPPLLPRIVSLCGSGVLCTRSGDGVNRRLFELNVWKGLEVWAGGGQEVEGSEKDEYGKRLGSSRGLSGRSRRGGHWCS
jgi:hypothetical protein